MPYTLIISEKPSAAQRIASALAEGKVEEIKKQGVKSYKITRKGKDIVVAPAVGHLFILTEKKSGGKWTYPVFDVEWKPTFGIGKHSLWSKKYFDSMTALAKGADDFISSCDYDVEGSVIAFNILRFICGTEKAKRMKFSTLTTGDLVEAYEKAGPKLDFPQIEAGLTRHTLDFFWGINLSRALTLSLEAVGGYKTLSTGRVQGPTLEILEKRQREIEAFKPKPFWQIQLTCKHSKQDIIAMHEKDKFWERGKAKSIHDKCKDKPAAVEAIEKREHIQNPPFPFDLTTLQRESYRNFGYSPKMTLDIAQSLYEQALISYPRTSSQELPAKIGFKKILKDLGNQLDYGKFCEQLLKKPVLRPTKGKKKDPAHPAIYPTGHRPKKLNSYQKKLYDLIVKRFLSVFGEPAKRESLKVIIIINGEKFHAEGIRTIDPKWMEFYMPYAKYKEVLLPKLDKGQELDVKGLDLLDKETQPPRRFTQAGILKEMEAEGLGTKATRAGILETLYDRDYIQDRDITVTKLGQSVITALEKYAPEVISIELTRDFDNDMEVIEEGKKKREDIVKSARVALEKILVNFKKHEKNIGKHLLKDVIEQHKIETTIGKCKCGHELIIRRSRKGARFVGCTGYPKCHETFSLPHFGMVKVMRETCKKCGLFVVSCRSKGKRPWKLCVRCGFLNSKDEPVGKEEYKGKGKGKAKPASKAAKSAPKTDKAFKTARKVLKRNRKKAANSAKSSVKATKKP
jgi:DNA topoisomerase-1